MLAGGEVLMNSWIEMVQRSGVAVAMERFANVSDGVTEGRSNDKVEEKRDERTYEVVGS